MCELPLAMQKSVNEHFGIKPKKKKKDCVFQESSIAPITFKPVTVCALTVNHVICNKEICPLFQLWRFKRSELINIGY